MKPDLIFLACSTGGPQALYEVIPHLPGHLGVPMLLVQHMPKGFTKALAERLDQTSKVTVKEAEHGEKLLDDYIYIAPGGKHMLIQQNAKGACISIDDGPPVNSLKPCADVTLDSICKSNFQNILCIVLTGMGSDATVGIKNLSEVKNVYCITENKETCVVYGMPKSVEQNNLSDEVVPLGKIASAITKKLGG